MRTINLDEQDVVAVYGALLGYQAELQQEIKSEDVDERETAIADLARVDRLLVIFS
jgi:hypothetical protein